LQISDLVNAKIEILNGETMPLLKDNDRAQLRKEFERLQNSVKLVFFTQADDCEYCPITQQILEEVVTLSDKIELQVFNFATDKEAAEKFKIKRVPAIAITRVEPTLLIAGGHASATRERDYGIRYYGVPSGYEFASLVSDLIDVSSGDSGLSVQSKAMLAQLKQPLHLQVFSTPT
jgi:alkyl hydroperoxide reductase subunit AhpF